jgi:hypothetical protein
LQIAQVASLTGLVPDVRLRRIVQRVGKRYHYIERIATGMERSAPTCKVLLREAVVLQNHLAADTVLSKNPSWKMLLFDLRQVCNEGIAPRGNQIVLRVFDARQQTEVRMRFTAVSTDAPVCIGEEVHVDDAEVHGRIGRSGTVCRLLRRQR